MSKELIANLGVVSRCLSNAGYPKMSLIVEQASETLSHLPDREEVARVVQAELERQCAIGAGEFEVCAETGLWNIGMHLDSRALFTRILSLMESKA